MAAPTSPRLQTNTRSVPNRHLQKLQILFHVKQTNPLKKKQNPPLLKAKWLPGRLAKAIRNPDKNCRQQQHRPASQRPCEIDFGIDRALAPETRPAPSDTLKGCFP